MLKNNKKAKPLIIVVLSLVIMLSTTIIAKASIWDSIFSGSDDNIAEIVAFLRSHSDWLQFGNILTVMLHGLAWLFIKGLYVITSFMESLIPESLSLLGFLDDSGFQGILKAVLKDLVSVLMVLTLVYLGIKTVVAKEPPKFKSVGVNIMMSALLLMGLPSLMGIFEDISKDFYDATQTGNNNKQSSSLAWNLIQDNTADLIYVADHDFDAIKNESDSGKKKNALTPELFKTVNLTELITPDTLSEIDGTDTNLDSLKYTLSADSNGNYTATEIKGGALSFFSDSFDSGYFRYPAKFFPILIGLPALFIAYLFTLFVFISTVIEIGFKQIVGVLVFATDLESGQKTKMVVQDILNAFMLIAFTGLGLKMYTLFLTYLSKSHVNILIYVIALVAATFILIKGSSTIMRYFGVDVGLKDGFAQMAGAFAVGRATAGSLSSAKNMFGNRNKSNSESANQENV